MLFQDSQSLILYWLILFVLGTIEWGMSTFWASGYARMGIPIYVRHISVKRHYQFWFLARELQETVKGNFWHPTIVARLLNSNEVVFRHKLLSFDIGLGNQKPFRGTIRFDSNIRSVIIQGRLPMFEPFYMIGVLWYLGYFAQRMIHLFHDPGIPIQAFLIYMAVVLILMRGLLAFSYYKFGNRLVEILSKSNMENLKANDGPD